MPGLFDPPMVKGETLTTEQQQRAAALLTAKQAVGPKVGTFKRVLAAEYIVNGAAGFVVLTRALAAQAETLEIRTADGDTARTIYSDGIGDE